MSLVLPRVRRVSGRRLLAAGLLTAALAGLFGGALELRRFGPDTEAATARVEAAVRREFEAMTARVTRVATSIAEDPEAAAALEAGPDGARRLFDLLSAARGSGADADPVAATVYDANGVARAWVGRPSDTLERLRDPSPYFVTPSALGQRLFHVQSILGADGRRLGTVAVEHVLGSGAAAASITAPPFTLATALAPVSLRTRYEGAGQLNRPGAFMLHAPTGEPLVEAFVAAGDLDAARARWRRRVVATVIGFAGLTILFLIGPLLDRRADSADDGVYVRTTLGAGALLLAGSAVFCTAIAVWSGGLTRSPAVLLLLAYTAVAAVALLVAPVTRLRLWYRGVRRTPVDAPSRFAAEHLLAGVLAAMVVVGFDVFLDAAVVPAGVDLRHFSLHPLVASRLVLLSAVVGVHVAALWAATLAFLAVGARWRLPRSASAIHLLVLALWLLPSLAAAWIGSTREWSMPAAGFVASIGICGVGALIGPRVVVWYRHATVAARILALFLAVLLPALLFYPTADYYATRTLDRLIATRFSVEARNHPQTLLDLLAEAQREIDQIEELPDLVAGGPAMAGSATPAPPDRAFAVWSRTALARARLTSAVELYDRGGSLISRFSLNLPEYAGPAQNVQTAPGCQWDVFGEAGFTSEDWPWMLHAERHICDPEAPSNPVGTIVIHVLFDYRTLPFISTQSPYFEVFRPSEAGPPVEGTPGRDVEVAVYGWGLGPIYTSGRVAWPITDALFERIYDPSREPFWAEIEREDDRWRVHFSSDRSYIYAIGYPSLTAFDRLVHIAELTTLAGVIFVVVLLGTGLFTRVSRERPRIGRALLREIRASFYRKLFLAFVLASIIPVVTLALVIRTYFADLLRAEIQAEAARTASVAQRVIEESDALLRRSGGALAPVNDDLMVWISQVIDQDVNIFDGARLVATSERDLFASGLLPTRTPDDVYRAIELQRLPSFVDEDQIGTFPYMIAAAPVRAGGRNAILTVPLGLRTREIEREIDELDRGVHLAALFFILLGAAIGLSLAERIADPVRRLTRATRRIASGDFDARIAVRSADELKRLVDAFNSMAAELKAQRAQLERTHRLEAWAEMARQVAHEIKNPLTPIQLSAEHLRRVHADRGEPMGPVLEGCVASILGQVSLLRQIAAEFSNFASSPIAKPQTADLIELVENVLEPYRIGLADRIAIEIRATGPLPPVLIDRTLVARALANIVENAVYAMPRTGSLTLDASAADGFVTLEIRDTGVGMDEEALARVFEPYFSTKTTGTGLGLPIARRNIELSGGTIEVESQKGRGTLVRMTLPVAPSG